MSAPIANAQVQSASAGFSPPEQVDEYSLIRPIGRGAMGQVYLGHDALLDRPVAIKFVAALRPDASLRERFLTEARAIARLLHPNVVAIYRVGAIDGRPYLVYEFVRGRSLSEIDKPLPWRRVLKIGMGLASGLAAAHARGVLHRDIKPANVLLSSADEVKLVDFGLAKLVQDSGGIVTESPQKNRLPRLRHPQPPTGNLEKTISFIEPILAAPTAESAVQLLTRDLTSRALADITHPGARLGTPLYMAPEIWAGEPGSERSDLYSLGALLYELCCGSPPHQARTTTELETIVQTTDAQPIEQRVDSIDPLLAQAINSCLQRDPQERMSSAAALCQVLEDLGAHSEAVAVPEGNPYRGLRPFEAADCALLYGRAQDIRGVMELLRTAPLVLITGDSGVGKSSLCRAGVLPQILEGALNDGRRWSVASLSPGRWAVHSLADALTPHLRMRHNDLVALLRSEPGMVAVALSERLSENRGLLLFIDQMEEIVTQSTPADAVLLGELLSHLSQRLPGVRVLATVRGDFLTRLAERTRLSYELSRALYLLRTPSASELREVIVGPARLKGVSFESDAMIHSMVSSTESAQGGLPLLEFTLAQLWESRDIGRGVIRTKSLDQLGGVEGSLARYADGVLERMLPDQRVASQRLLMRLVRLDGTRLPRNEEELLTGDPSELAALDVLVRSRLVVARRIGAETNAYELAHEALLKGWSRLREWLGNARERRAVIERAETAAREWDRLGRPKDLLWRNLQLAEVEKLQGEPGLSAPLLSAFLKHSRRYARREQGFRYALIAILILSALGSAIGGTLWYQEEELRLNHSAVQIRLTAQQAGRENQAMYEALKLVHTRWRRNRTPPIVDQTLHDVLMSPGLDIPALVHEGPVRWVGFSPDARLIISASDDGTAGLWDAASGKLMTKLRGHQGAVTRVRFAPDGRTLVSASKDGTAQIWECHTGKRLALLKGHGGSVNDALFSRNGQQVLTVSADHRAILWKPTTGQALLTLSGHTGSVTTAAFSPDGREVVTASADKTARIWRLPSGELLHTLVGHKQSINVVNYAPDGLQLVTGGDDKIGILWETQTGRQRAVLTDHRSEIVSAEFSADGERILTAASSDVAARLWDAASGVRLMTLNGHYEQLRWTAFSPDGQRIATVGADHLVRLWHGVTGTPIATYRGHRSEVLHAAFAPGGRRLATAGQDNTVRVWVEQLGDVVILPQHPGPVWAGAFSPDGQTVATVSGAAGVRLWETKTGHLIAKLQGHHLTAVSAAFSPDGKWLATGSFDTRDNVILWDLSRHRMHASLKGHTDRVPSMMFSADGQRLLTTSYDNTARIWSIPEGNRVLLLNGHTQPIYKGGFSPDNGRVVTASADGTARIWDATTGQTLHTLSGHRSGLRFAEFSGDGKYIATASEDNTARLWNGNTGELLHELKGHTDTVMYAAFSPTSPLLVTVGMDGIGIGWNVETGQQLYSLIGHDEAILDVHFAQDGKRLVTASSDHTARLWTAEMGQPLGILRGHLRLLNFAVFSPDGSTVLTGSTDATGRLHPVQRQALLQQACTHLSRWTEYRADIKDMCQEPR